MSWIDPADREDHLDGYEEAQAEAEADRRDDARADAEAELYERYPDWGWPGAGSTR